MQCGAKIKQSPWDRSEPTQRTSFLFMLVDLIILSFLLCLSAFFSAAETAFFTLSRTKARHLAKDNEQPYVLIHQLKENPHRLLTTLLIGNNAANIGASALATSVALQVFPDYALGGATGIMTLLILVFGEVFPKSLATRNNVAVAGFTVYPVYWCSILFFPFSTFLNFIPLLTGKAKKTSIFGHSSARLSAEMNFSFFPSILLRIALCTH